MRTKWFNLKSYCLWEVEGIISGGGFSGMFLLSTLPPLLAGGTGAVPQQWAQASASSLARNWLFVLHAGVLPVTVGIALSSKDKSISGVCCWWVTLSKSPLNASCCLLGYSARQKGQRSAPGLCETPRQGSFSCQFCKWGALYLVWDNRWQNWGAADGLLLFTLVKLSMLHGSLTQAPPRETGPSKVCACSAIPLGAGSHTPLFGSPVSSLCHTYHHPKPLESFIFSALTFLSLLPPPLVVPGWCSGPGGTNDLWHISGAGTPILSSTLLCSSQT